MSRITAALFAALITGFAILVPASAASASAPLCTTGEFANPSNFNRCTDALHGLSQDKLNCVKAPTPEAPDDGMAGWFATEPTSARGNNIYGPDRGIFSHYGYAGYDYTTYDIGCIQTTMHPDYKFENTVANGEFMISTSMLGATNAIREHAWDPHAMYGWADPLVTKLTRTLYDRVFTVLGIITLGIVGLYLLWRSRQADMNHAVTTAGWAILVIVLATAVAQWPIYAANVADKTLTGTLGTIHKALSAVQPAPTLCINPDPRSCVDRRPPAIAVSDVTTYGLLYRNWLRGELGSADSATAQKYGPALYDAKSLTWGEARDAAKDPHIRTQIMDQKARQYERIALQVQQDDPQAYEYLQGQRGMDRIGAGFVSIIAALSFMIFDIAASILVLIGFLIFRWAVIILPLLATIGLFRPASAGLMRIRDMVIGSIFNIVIFGTAAAIYAFFVDTILSTTSLAGWLQVFLILLVGAVAWIAARPYRRLKHLGGHDPLHTASKVAIAGAAADQAASKTGKKIAVAVKAAMIS